MPVASRIVYEYAQQMQYRIAKTLLSFITMIFQLTGTQQNCPC